MHMTGDEKLFTKFFPFPSSTTYSVVFGDGVTLLPATGIGTIELLIESDQCIRLHDTILVPGLHDTLYSLKRHVEYPDCAFHGENSRIHLSFPTFTIQAITDPEVSIEYTTFQLPAPNPTITFDSNPYTRSIHAPPESDEDTSTIATVETSLSTRSTTISSRAFTPVHLLPPPSNTQTSTPSTHDIPLVITIPDHDQDFSTRHIRPDYPLPDLPPVKDILCDPCTVMGILDDGTRGKYIPGHVASPYHSTKTKHDTLPHPTPLPTPTTVHAPHAIHQESTNPHSGPSQTHTLPSTVVGLPIGIRGDSPKMDLTEVSLSISSANENLSYLTPLPAPTTTHKTNNIHNCGAEVGSIRGNGGEPIQEQVKRHSTPPPNPPQHHTH